MLIYITEPKFYGQSLDISYEFGSYLRERGALSIDAETDYGRLRFGWAICLCSPLLSRNLLDSVLERKSELKAQFCFQNE